MKDKLVIGILAHVDAGKTTLSEAILFETGSIRKMGRVDNQDAFLDTYSLERERGITIFSKQAVLELGEHSLTLLDTPGHVDFSAEMERTLQVLDYAVLVISGADGVQGHTETLWKLLARYEIPTFLFVNKMDQNGTDRETLLAELTRRLSSSCVAFDVEPDSLLDQLAMGTEAAMEEYLETGRIRKEVVRGMIAERKVFPVYFGSALKLTGVEELLDGLEEYMQAPVYGEAFAAKVFKISRDEQGNRLTYLKVTGGSLKVRDQLTLQHKYEEKPSAPDGAEEEPEEGLEEKVNQIRIYSGTKYEAVSEADAGTVCAVLGLTETWPGQGLGAEPASEQPLLEPVLTYQVILPPGMDPQPALQKLRRLEEEEPELHIAWDEHLKEIQAQVMGEVQIEILRHQLQERFGMDVHFGEGRIVYKETLAMPCEGVGHFEPLRHYAEVHLFMEPGERGSGLQFETRCSEDVLDRNWQRLILTHLEERRHRGILTGGELTDTRIIVIAGKAHTKHTVGGDFRQATYRAVRQGLMEGGCRLLEPWYAFRLELPMTYVGRALSDLDQMQARFSQPDQEGELTIIEGKAPVSLMRNYQREVVAYTKGRGKLTCSPAGYELCHDEEEVVARSSYDPELDSGQPTGSVFCAHGAGFYIPWYLVKNYMHVETGLPEAGNRAAMWRQLAAEGGDSTVYGGFGTVEKKPDLNSRELHSTGSSSKNGSMLTGYAAEEELMEIFHRTYRKSEEAEKRPGRSPRRLTFAEQTYVGQRRRPADAKEYLLVDGYNVIFAWEELRELSEINLDAARERLMDILCNYQGYKKCELILVFDAYKVSGGIGEAIAYHNIHVIYTKEAETADAYIEKLAHKIGREAKVTVATSDGLEQLIIRGAGCILMTARELKQEVAYLEEQIRRDHLEPLREESSRKKISVMDAAGEDVQAYLASLKK